MRKIKIGRWKEVVEIDGKKQENEANLLSALNWLLTNKNPATMPKGFDQFRLFHKINKAFEKADKSGTLILEEPEYKFLKGVIETDIPAIWAGHLDISAAIMAFMDAKEV